MTRSGIKNVIRYVRPAILSNICFFFTITDAVFISRGIGTNALGAMNSLFHGMFFTDYKYQRLAEYCCRFAGHSYFAADIWRRSHLVFITDL